MQIQADRFLALTAMLAGFVPNGADPQGSAPEQQVEAPAPAATRPVETCEARSRPSHPSHPSHPSRPSRDDVRRGG